ncbi:MAG: hypothetical protein N2C14_12740, partial [Planctomycetales bacterium]
MAWITEKVGYLACPKTGSAFVRSVLSDGCGWNLELVGDNEHDARRDKIEERSPGLPVITTIRRPETWLPSVFRWMRRQSAVGEWRPFPGPAAILNTLQGDDYPTFVRDVLDHMPGVCGRIQEQYVQAADIALRQENLTEELTAWLRATI